MRIYILAALVVIVPMLMARNILINTNDIDRLEPPFILEAGKQGAHYYISALETIDQEHNTPTILPCPEVPLNTPLNVWVRIWWESGATSSCELTCGETIIRFSGSGYSDTWQWIKHENPVTLTAQLEQLTIKADNGRFSLDQILFSSDMEGVPAGHIEIVGKPGTPIYMHDDFMREPEAGTSRIGEWRIVTGGWRQYMISNVRKGKKSSQAERSANAFALWAQGRKETPGLLTAGKSEWRNYQIRGSIRLEGKTTAGPVFNYQDENNYYYFAISSDPEMETRLIRMWNGKPVILAAAAQRIEAGTYYAFEAEAVNGTIITRIDDSDVFQIRDTRLLSGQAGLACWGGQPAVFDDVLITDARLIREDFETWSAGRWQMVSGEWWVRFPRGSAGLFASLGAKISNQEQKESARLIGTGEGTVIIGDSSWQAYDAEVLMELSGKEETGGLVFNYTAPEDYWTFSASVLRDTDFKQSLQLRLTHVQSASPVLKEEVTLDTVQMPIRLGFQLEQHKGRFSCNGVTVCQLVDAGLNGGAFGLQTVSQYGIAFDDIRIDFRPKSEPEAWRTVVPQFEEENSMRNWARDASDWVTAANGRTDNIKDFFGDVTIAVPWEKPDQSYTLFIHNQRKGGQGYRLECLPQEDSCKVVLYREEQKVAEGHFAKPHTKSETPPLLELAKDGYYLSGIFNGVTCVEFRDPDPIEDGPRVAVILPKRQAAEEVQIRSTSMLNYYFTRSPVDWYVRGGDWRITNRWKCDPRWSWYGGRADGLAALWNKHELSGDFTIDLFMSMQMDEVGQPHYYHPGNMNITVCGDGENIGSGYSFIFGGERGTVTRIMRKDTVVAETDEELFLPPSTRDRWQPMEGEHGLHRRWFHLTVVRRGRRLEYFLDNRLMLSYDDPQPLAGKRFGIWTYDNGIMVARIRASAQAISDRKTNWLVKQPGLDPTPVKPFLTVTSPTHPFGYEDSRDQWVLHTNQQEAVQKAHTAQVVSTEYKDRFEVLAITNRQTGGKYSLKLYEGRENLTAMRTLQFDYAIDNPLIKADIIIQTSSGWFYYQFAGDRQLYRPGQPPFYPRRIGGQAPIRDGAWHTATIPIYTLLQGALGSKTCSRLKIMQVFLAWGSYGYTDAGLTGNPLGARYYLDNIRIRNAGKDTFTAAWHGGNANTQYAFSLDEQIDTIPDPLKAVSAKEHTYTNLNDGRYYFHIIPVDPEITDAQPEHYQVIVDRTPPEVSSVEIQPEYTDILAEDPGSGIDWESLSLIIGNQTLEYNSDYCRPLDNGLGCRLNYNQAGLQLPSGKLSVSIITLKDFNNNVLRKPFAFRGVLAAEDDTIPPRIKIVPLKYFAGNKFGFEQSQDLWQTWVGPKVTVMRDPADPAEGLYSMGVFHNSNATNFRIEKKLRFNAAAVPVLSFKYRLQPDVRVNLGVKSIEGDLNIGFCDQNSDSRTIAHLKDIQADGAWHSTIVPLRDMLTSSRDGIPSLDISSLIFEDIQWRGADPLTRYWIDDFYLHEVYDNSKGTMRVWIDARDPSGINQLQWRLVPLQGGDDGVLWHTISNPRPDNDGLYSFKIPASAEGDLLLEATAQDANGNQSDVAVFPVLIDNSKPEMGAPVPKPGTRAAVSKVIIPLKDRNLKRGSIKLDIDGRPYTLNNKALSYSGKTGNLIFDVSQRRGADIFQHDKKINVGVYAQDGVGHPLKQMWQWTMDYTKDTQAPPAPYLTRLPSLKKLDTFESSNGEWKARSGKRGGGIRITDNTSALGNKSLEVYCRHSDGSHDCFIRQSAFNALEYSMITMDYRIAPKVAVDIMALVDGKWYAIQLTSKSTSYPVIGKYPAIADGQWHHADINLGKMLAEKLPGKKAITVRNLIMGEWDKKHKNPHNAVYGIDNFSLYRPQDAKPFRFAWNRVYDATGIKSFYYAFSTDQAAVPDVSAGLRTVVEVPAPGPGQWYFKLSAQDANDNLSIPAIIGPLSSE